MPVKKQGNRHIQCCSQELSRQSGKVKPKAYFVTKAGNEYTRLHLPGGKVEAHYSSEVQEHILWIIGNWNDNPESENKTMKSGAN